MTSMFRNVYMVGWGGSGGQRQNGVKQHLTTAFNLLQPGWT